MKRLFWMVCTAAIGLGGCALGATENDDPPGNPCGCAAREACIEDLCIPTCAEGTDCAIGQICTADGLCAAAEGCGSDSDCGRDQVCLQGGCYDMMCDDGVERACATACGDGVETCLGGVFTGCTAPQEGPDGCPELALQSFVRHFDRSSSDIAEAVLVDDQGFVIAGRLQRDEDTDKETLIVAADDVGTPQWQVRVASDGFDQINALARMPDGRILAIGQGRGTTDNLSDGLLQVYTKEGALESQRIIGDEGNDIIHGGSGGPDGFVLAGQTPSEEGSGAWLVRLDTNLDVLWQVAADGPGRRHTFYGAVPTPDGGAIAAGVSDVDGEGLNVLVMAFDGAGAALWQKTWGGDEVDQGKGIALRGDRIYVSGHTRSFGQGDHDAFVLGMSLNGDLVWQRVIGTTGVEIAEAIDAHDGGIVLAGRSVLGEDEDGWFAGLDFEGELQWEHRLRVDGFQTFNSVGASGNMAATAGFSSQNTGSDWIVAAFPTDGRVPNGCTALVRADLALSTVRGADLVPSALTVRDTPFRFADRDTATATPATLTDAPICRPEAIP